VSGDGRSWLLCNASPDIHRQLSRHLPIEPSAPARSSPIAAVLLADGQIDHALGLLLLREHRARLPVWTTAPVRDDLSTTMPLLPILDHYCGVDWHEVPADGEPFTVDGVRGVTVRAFAVPGKPGPYSLHRQAPRPGDNSAFLFTDEHSAQSILYAPGLAAVDKAMHARLAAAAAVLVDGTCFYDDDLARQGISTKTARDMGHLPQSGAGGMVEALAALPSTVRRILTHINNTNPILDEDSAERAFLTERGIEIAYDGMEITL
jgi:pyrroloquinoline quinone biosynthesis protein B